MAVVKGRRVYPDADGRLFLAEGDYGQDKDGWWNVRPPKSGAGFLTGPRVDDPPGWTVTVHEDGTISAAPSIDTGAWHGYLTCGEWRD